MDFLLGSDARPVSDAPADLNFQVPVHVITKQTTCTCKDGFHCSTSECITCVPHTTCKPGYGVLSEGKWQRLPPSATGMSLAVVV